MPRLVSMVPSSQMSSNKFNDNENDFQHYKPAYSNYHQVTLFLKTSLVVFWSLAPFPIHPRFGRWTHRARRTKVLAYPGLWYWYLALFLVTVRA